MKTNSISIVGKVGREPEMRAFENDKQVVKFSVANYNSFDKSTQWFNVDCWNAELGNSILESIGKGANVRVTGSLKVNRFEKKDGTGEDFRLVIRLEEFELLEETEKAPVEPEMPARKRRRSAA